MNTDHTITKSTPVDGALLLLVAPSASVNPTTGPSTGLHTGTGGPQNKVAVNANTESVQVPTDDNRCVFIQLIWRVSVISGRPHSDAGERCHQEPLVLPQPSSMPAPPPVVRAYAIDLQQVAGKLMYLQRRMGEMKRATDGEQAGEKENVAPDPRPLKRKRAATRPTPTGPVRQSARLQRKRQRRDKE